MSKGLGRLLRHDPKSRNFPAHRPLVRRNALWSHRARVLDQGFLGACTGFALAQMLNTDAFARNRVRERGYLGSDAAIGLYSLATRKDDFDGEYPPDDTGSSGLAVCKAGADLGYFPEYSHAFGFEHFARALQTQPVIVGTNWYESMDSPTSQGRVFVQGKDPIGGHEYLALGINWQAKFVTFLNSWGEEFGHRGRFFVSFDDFDRLLREDGDVQVPKRMLWQHNR